MKLPYYYIDMNTCPTYTLVDDRLVDEWHVNNKILKEGKEYNLFSMAYRVPLHNSSIFLLANVFREL